MDNDGITDTALPIKVALEVAGDRLTLDFTGTAPACAGPINIALPTAIACLVVRPAGNGTTTKFIRIGLRASLVIKVAQSYLTAAVV